MTRAQFIDRLRDVLDRAFTSDQQPHLVSDDDIEDVQRDLDRAVEIARCFSVSPDEEE